MEEKVQVFSHFCVKLNEIQSVSIAPHVVNLCVYKCFHEKWVLNRNYNLFLGPKEVGTYENVPWIVCIKCAYA